MTTDERRADEPPDQPGDQPGEELPPRPLTPPPVVPLVKREPRSLLVHVCVDTAIAFLALVVLLLVLGVTLWIIAIAAVILGIAAAPWSRSAEARALARRDAAS